MRIGLFFGSFNPPHVGHTIVAGHMLEVMQADEVWMVVSPQNPFKAKEGLLDENIRLQLVTMACDGLSHIKASDVEFDMAQPSFTIDTLEKLKESRPEDEFFIIMGSDNILKIDKWKGSEKLLAEFSIAVYPRKGYKVKKKLKASLPDTVHFVACPIVDLSSTEVRRRVSEKEAFEFLVRKSVADELNAKGHYST